MSVCLSCYLPDIQLTFWTTLVLITKLTRRGEPRPSPAPNFPTRVPLHCWPNWPVTTMWGRFLAGGQHQMTILYVYDHPSWPDNPSMLTPHSHPTLGHGHIFPYCPNRITVGGSNLRAMSQGHLHCLPGQSGKLIYGHCLAGRWSIIGSCFGGEMITLMTGTLSRWSIIGNILLTGDR